jgi:hypothetical protein
VAQAMLLQGVQRSGDGNAPRPGFERALAPVLVEAGKDFNERILERVLRFGPVGAVAQAHAHEQASQLLVKPVLRRRFAAPTRSQQRLIDRGNRGRHVR